MLRTHSGLILDIVNVYFGRLWKEQELGRGDAKKRLGLGLIMPPVSNPLDRLGYIIAGSG